MGNPSTLIFDWDKPKLLEFIRWMESHDGAVVGMSIQDCIKELHWGQGSFQKTIEAAEVYGIITITRSGLPGFGLGRVPNRYELVIGHDQWVATGHAVVAEFRRNGGTTRRLRKRAIVREGKERARESGALGSETVYSKLPGPPPGGAWMEVTG